MRGRREARAAPDEQLGTPAARHGSLIAARLSDGPMAGTTIEVAAVEGRPPKTVDVDAPDASCSRYCLAEWEQTGHTADYTFLYQV